MSSQLPPRFRPIHAALLAAAVLLLVGAPTHARETGSVEDGARPERPANRSFHGLGFHTHLEVGGVWGQQDLAVTTVDEAAILQGESMDGDAVASGIGLATRLELWPAYGRYAAAGVYGAGHVGGLRRGDAGTGVLGGSTGVLAAAGPTRFRALGLVGRSWRGGVYGEGASWAKALSGEVDQVTAGAERVRAYRAGVGVRSGFDSSERSGLDLWLLWDEPTSLRGNNAPVVSLPQRGQSAMLFRTSLWMQNALAVSAEVTVRPNPAETETANRTALISLSWSMDRFSNYGRD